MWVYTVILQTSISKAPVVFMVDSGLDVNLIASHVLYSGTKLVPVNARVSTLNGSEVPFLDMVLHVQV